MEALGLEARKEPAVCQAIEGERRRQMTKKQVAEQIAKALEKLSFRKKVEGKTKERVLASLTGYLLELQDAASRFVRLIDRCHPAPSAKQAGKFFTEMDFVIAELGCIFRRLLRLWDSRVLETAEGYGRWGQTYQRTDWAASTDAAEEQLAFLAHLAEDTYWLVSEGPFGEEAACEGFSLIEDLAHIYASVKESVSILEFISTNSTDLERADMEYFVGVDIVMEFLVHTWSHLQRVARPIALNAGCPPV